MIDWYLGSVLIFVIAMVLTLYKDRRNIERSSVLLIRRTEKGKSLIKKIANACPKFWRWVGNIGILIGFLFSVWVVWQLLEVVLIGLFTNASMTGLSLVIPSASPNASIGPGYFAVPFWYWIIAIGLLVLVHEGMHGIMTVIGKTRIKSLGWGVLAVLPLAFVEPDEKALSKKSLVTRLRVYAAGSLSNFIFAGIYILIFIVLIVPLFIPAGVAYAGTIEGYPARDANMSRGAITDINGYVINDANDLSSALETIGADKDVEITVFNGTDNLTYNIRTATNPNSLEFKPDWTTDFIIGIESNFPGTKDILDSVSAVFSGGKKTNWFTLNYDKEFWEYAKNNNPAITAEATERIAGINSELEGRNEPGFIGIGGLSSYVVLGYDMQFAEPVITFIRHLLEFLVLLNFGVGLANLLPIVPLDGGKMWEDLFREYVPKQADIIMKTLSILTFVIIIAAFIIPMLK